MVPSSFTLIIHSNYTESHAPLRPMDHLGSTCCPEPLLFKAPQCLQPGGLHPLKLGQQGTAERSMAAVALTGWRLLPAVNVLLASLWENVTRLDLP